MTGCRAVLSLLAGLAGLLSPAVAEIGLADHPVDFLAAAPVIDGRLDADLTHLPARTFAEVRRFGTDADPVQAAYHLAYGTGFLYLHVTAAGDSLTCRDRAYQNGDGLHLIVSRVMPDGAPSEEFYVLACSAVDRPAMEWSRRVFWYYNVDTIFLPVSEDVRLGTAVADGTIQFEVLLPWADVHPWHPWLGDGVGFDLAFCKATAPDGVLYYTARPYTRYLGTENQPRETTPLRFAPPHVDGAPQTFVQLDRGHVRAGEPVTATAAAVSATDRPAPLSLTLRTAEGATAHRARVTLDLAPGLDLEAVTIETGSLPAGGYLLSWRAGTTRGEGRLTVLPAFRDEQIGARVDALAGSVSAGSAATLACRHEEIVRKLAALHPYETAGAERLALARLLADVEQGERGVDVIAARRGFFRRAYRSALDGTLQPYAVRIPDDYDPGRRYPLLVFLHGSASDETDLAGFAQLNPGGWLELAPRGRGPSNGWTADHAQDDVAEALADMTANYAVDPDRIVLCGFSMGGYGVYRTHLAMPDRFRGLVVLSGLPTWGEGNPDLRDPSLHAAFADVPVFVFHGERDRNCPFADTVELVDGLRGAGARVRFVRDPERGHEAIGPDTRAALHRWLREVAGG